MTTPADEAAIAMMAERIYGLIRSHGEARAAEMIASMQDGIACDSSQLYGLVQAYAANENPVELVAAVMEAYA